METNNAITQRISVQTKVTHGNALKHTSPNEEERKERKKENLTKRRIF